MAISFSIRNAALVAVSAVMLLACAKPAPPAESTATANEPAAATPDLTTPDPAAAPATMPSPQDPPTASNEPALDAMPLARPSAKLSVAADVRYQIDGPIAPGQSATLHLAVVPRIGGAPVQVSLTENPGLTLAAGPASVQKLGTRDVLRQQYAVTRSAASATEVRVLVTMEAAEGTGFGFFTIPLEGGNPSRKLDSVKQR